MKRSKKSKRRSLIALVSISLILSVILSSASCSRRTTSMKEVYWNGQEGRPPKIDERSFKKSSTIDIKNEKISINFQTINGAEIEHSFLKKIQIGEKLDYVAGVWFERPPVELSKEIEFMRGLSATVVPALQRQDGRFKDYKYDGSPIVVVRADDFAAQAFWKVVYFDKSGVAWSVRVTKTYQVVSEEREGSSFQDAMALVYPDSPKHSDISNVLLKQLTGDGSLTSGYLTVLTESTSPVRGENNLFNFTPPDEKFDQVQVFYFISRALNWFTDTLGVRIPFAVKAIVHVGYPNKENTAFYYNGQIRLGSGDDIVYSKMPLDPSITMHEAGHALVDAIARLPFQGEGGSINEAMADFFTCVQLKSPFLGDVSYRKAPFRRTVSNKLRVSDKNGGVYHDSGIVSGTLWAIYEKLGEEKSTAFALKVLSRLNPLSDFNSLGKTFNELVETQFKGEDIAIARQIIVEREWR